MELTLPLRMNLTHVHLTDEQFHHLCIDNPDLVLERNAKGVLITVRRALEKDGWAITQRMQVKLLIYDEKQEVIQRWIS
ncbi:hypothetical protein LEP3755_06660 [Leptolyngbya sp. NIES-3755]|nr:hypothetical protein LEP3755_06660 [Leptolyngbya sp. NIES-3755]